mgnify:CR=1 FL=1
MAITSERMEELDRAWNESDFMDDQEYQDWYEELTPEERCLIDSLDKQYSQAFQHLTQEQKRTKND